MKTLCPLLLIVLSSLCLADKPVTLAINPTTPGNNTDGTGAFIIEIANAELGNLESISLVDRKSLENIIKEQGLTARGLTQNAETAKIGKILGAQYFVSFRMVAAGKHKMISCRVVQVNTTLYKSIAYKIAEKSDPATAGSELAAKIKNSITQLAAKEIKSAPQKTKLKLDDSLEKPVVAMRILETAIGTRPVDPASEIQMIKALNHYNITNKQLSFASKSVAAGTAAPLEGKAHKAWLNEAKKSGVSVLIIGEAFSERALPMGSLETSRSRIELHAFRVSDGKVIHADSAYGTGVDATQLVAGKKAIQQATDRLAPKFIIKVVENWQK